MAKFELASLKAWPFHTSKWEVKVLRECSAAMASTILTMEIENIAGCAKLSVVAIIHPDEEFVLEGARQDSKCNCVQNVIHFFHRCD